MAQILALLTSSRRNGFTAGLLKEAVQAAERFPGITVDFVRAFDYKFGPCQSCYTCIRHPENFCRQDDDMGRKGEGALLKKVRAAHGLIIAQPVHFWGSAAMTHLFIERLYPFLSHTDLHGLPFASISCACNQGMMRVANTELARWAFTLKFRYIEGLPVHTVYYEKARQNARYLGEKLAQAALEDEGNGRHHFTDEEAWFDYMDKPWNALEPYLDNLTQGTFRWEPAGPTPGAETTDQSQCTVDACYL
jgi:NAD(P)H-dependent FMN reductase